MEITLEKIALITTCTLAGAALLFFTGPYLNTMMSLNTTTYHQSELTQEIRVLTDRYAQLNKAYSKIPIVLSMAGYPDTSELQNQGLEDGLRQTTTTIRDLEEDIKRREDYIRNAEEQNDTKKQSTLSDNLSNITMWIPGYFLFSKSTH